MDIKEKLLNTKLKLLEKINEKLESRDLTTLDMINISATFANIITFPDYADKFYSGFNYFGAQRIEENDKKIN